MRNLRAIIISTALSFVAAAGIAWAAGSTFFDGNVGVGGIIVSDMTHINGVKVTSGATGTAPILQASGDTNRNLDLRGNGTGIVTLGGSMCTVTGATPQTCNGQRGIVTTGTLTTAAATNAAYVINNSSVSATSLIQCTVQGYSGTIVTNGYPIPISCVPGSGTITVNLTNTHASNALNGTVQIGFSVQN